MNSCVNFGITKNNFVRLPAPTEIYLIVKPLSFRKNTIPVAGSEPISSAVFDNTTLNYVLFGEQVVLLKRFDFTPCIRINEQNFIVPFPHDYIIKKLKKKERCKFDEALLHTKEYTFFQVTVP